MEHDELTKHLTLELPPEFRFTDDQADVMYAFHEGSGRVAVGSGAGTGKTTTLTRIVAETVTRLAEPTPGDLDANPFDDILVTTFTRDAAGQLKTKIKHFYHGYLLHLCSLRWVGRSCILVSRISSHRFCVL